MNMVFPRVALALLLVAGMTGCVSSGGSRQPSAPASTSQVSRAPAGAVDKRCDGLIYPNDYYLLWGGELKSIGYTSFGAASTTTMEGTALVQSKSLICGWSASDGAPAALMIVMGGGADGFHRTEATFAAAGGHYATVPLLDGAFVACRGDESHTCHWNVLSGSDWISVMVVGLTSDQVSSVETVQTNQSSFISALATSVGALHLQKTPSVAPTADCTKLLTPDSLVAPLGVEASRIAVEPSPPLEARSVEDSSPEYGLMMWKYAYDLLGYSSCGILIDDHLVGAVIIAKDAAWVLNDSSAQQPKLKNIGGHGDGVNECASDGSSSSCTVAFASGKDLLVAQFSVPPGIDGAATALATLELLGR